jgi:hypothetical protein
VFCVNQGYFSEHQNLSKDFRVYRFFPL